MQCTLTSVSNKAEGRRNGAANLKRVSTQEKEKENRDRQDSNILWTF